LGFNWDGDALGGETESLIDPPDETPETTAALAKQREKLREALSKKSREYVYYPGPSNPWRCFGDLPAINRSTATTTIRTAARPD
jgi:hypothetical protein